MWQRNSFCGLLEVYDYYFVAKIIELSIFDWTLTEFKRPNEKMKPDCELDYLDIDRQWPTPSVVSHREAWPNQRFRLKRQFHNSCSFDMYIIRIYRYDVKNSLLSSIALMEISMVNMIRFAAQGCKFQFSMFDMGNSS